MVQTGDPTGTGKGGTSIWGGKFSDEITESLKHNTRGTLESLIIVPLVIKVPQSNGGAKIVLYDFL